MEKSKFEKFSDKLIFKIIKKIIENLKSDGIDGYANAKFNQEIFETISNSLNHLGFTTSTNDEDYLWWVLKKNLSVFENESLVSSLDRPQLKEYEYSVGVSETVYQTTTYKHTISCYSETPYQFVKTLYDEGEINYYNGDVIDVTVHDSDTNEFEVNRNSFFEI